ncbi:MULTISPECIES: BlaI/MecI/CopY family transcriptional regulator [Rhodopirellula]|uniref:CopY family transcriptional regulator n=1 Tax=Rhodopirellula bahusiensis TaxID=2014065 RepID=A0A2G1WAC0_9BACT|nr:BlaI/MecI/CopY family transcriptional regulator [Rhodopirellula bahusiensis]PHQ35973.1 CopY family transcriptional regulator [Rhodopirellula bahusiensis]|tara:strand:- start:15043 stop:15441 length:399 start_codon:yes stop_codon:yes gene_type:complete
MAKKKSAEPPKLGARERQILDAVYHFGRASVSDVRSRLNDPPSYSSVRTMMGILETKGFLRRDREGVRHLYSATRSREKAGRSALTHLMSTFFEGSPSKMLAALLDDSSCRLSDEELADLQRSIDQARKQGN